MKEKNFVWNSLAGSILISVIISIILLVAFYTLGSSSAASPAKQGQDIFEAECQSCHSIGGGAQVGPDLKGVLERRERSWVERFILSPDWVIAEGDPIALELLVEFNGIEMPNIALSEEEVELVLVYIELQDGLTQSAETLPAGNANNGNKLFLGSKSLEAGGTPCMACHTVGSVGTFGGGTLGPDLTYVYSRYGETGLSSAVQNISFPTMKNIYSDKSLTTQEAADLLAFFNEADKKGNEGLAEASTGLFWQAGSLGALILFLIMAAFWPRQSKNQTERLRKKADADSRRNS